MNKKKTLQENNFAMVQSQFAEKINILKKNEEKMVKLYFFFLYTYIVVYTVSVSIFIIYVLFLY